MSKHIKVLTLAWLAVLCAAYPAAFASSGTAAFQFFRLDNGARETALGGAATAAGEQNDRRDTSNSASDSIEL